MIRSILCGKVYKPAEARTSAGGKSYATASINLDAPEGQPRFARVTAFGDAAARLLDLTKGAAIAVSGKLEVSIWTPEGKPPEVQVRILADELIALPITKATAPQHERTNR